MNVDKVTEYINNLYAENQQLAFRLKNAEDNITNIKNYLETQYLEVHAAQVRAIEQNNNVNQNNANINQNNNNVNQNNANINQNNNNVNQNNIKINHIKSLSISMNFSKDYRNVIFNIIKVINIQRAFECAIDIAQQNLNGAGKNNAIIAGPNVGYACITYMCNPSKCNVDVILNTYANNSEINIDISVNTFIDMETLKAIKNAIYEAIIFKLNE
jgi:hypothetical protein